MTRASLVVEQLIGIVLFEMQRTGPKLPPGC